MFKLNSHKSDRLGERVEFRFSSFQAFQIPKGWDKLVLSLVSVDTGKTIAKANKATVRSGTCQWTETFSESIWTPQDNASKGIEECMCKIVVSMGSHRSGILGELIINLADYISSQDSGSLPLPLQKCNYGTILQVRIQCLYPKRRFRDTRSSNETPSYREDLHTNNDDVESKSDGSDSMLNRNLGYTLSSHSGVTYAEKPVNLDTSFSASGSHRSSDSEDSHNLNGGSFMGRQNSAGSHNSLSSSGPNDDMSRSNPSSFNSRASSSYTPMSLRPAGSSKDFLEAAEETVGELQDEAKMWERHAQKLKLDIEKYKKESSDKSRRQAELDTELKAAYSECDSLKQEIEQLKSSLEEVTTKQMATRAAKNEVMLRVQKELEGEVKFLKESNANLSLQLKKSQETNIELVSILEELEETVEKQRLERENFVQRSPVNEHEDGIWNEKLLAVEAEWAAKLSVKDEEIIKLEEKLSGMQNAEYPSEKELSSGYSDLIKEIEELRGKVQELERDCSELTEENLELIFKLKESGKGVRGENESENSDSEVDFLKSQIYRLEEELRSNEMNLEKIYADLDVELQFFKDQTNHLDIKLRESQLEVEEKSSEIKEIRRKLEGEKNAGNESEIEELKIAFSIKEKEVDILRRDKEELEILITNIQQDKTQLEENLASVLGESSMTSKCLEDIQHEMTLSTSTNKMLQRKSIELESSKNELEIHLVELEEENIQLSEGLSGLEAQLRYMTDDKESSRLELEDSNSVVSNLKDEIAELQVEIETQKGELKQKLVEAQKKLSETQEEAEHIKRSHLKLQSTIESLIEDNSLLQKSNVDLQRQKLELHQHSANLEVELTESHKNASESLEKVEFLELKLSSMQNDIVSKEKMITSQLENISQVQEDQEEKIVQTKLMLNQIDVENRVEVENLKREITHLSSQLCATHDERQKMASDAVLEVSSLHSDKIKLESNLQEACAKLKLYETEIQSLRQESSKKVQGLVDLLNASKQREEMLMSDIENRQRQSEAAKSGEEKLRRVVSELELKLRTSDYEKQSLRQESSKKVQGLVDLLNASKQSEEMLMSDIENMQRQSEAAKSSEEKLKRVVSELELKLRTSDYEKQQTVEESTSLKVQVQKIAHLQDEILVLKSALEEAKFEKGKLEEVLLSVSEECDGLKTERMSFMEKILNMQKALHDGEDDKCSRIALQEKVLRLEGDLSEKEASCAREAELKNEINRIKRANSEYQRLIQSLEEKCELMRKVQSRNETPSSDQQEEQSQEVVQLADADQTKRLDDSKDLEATIQELQSKIRLLENELAELVETNNMYKIQLQRFMAEKQSCSSEILKKSVSENDMVSQRSSKIASLEAELKDIKERYLHMSLQYAEVEAERQELILKLKTTTKGKGWFS